MGTVTNRARLDYSVCVLYCVWCTEVMVRYSDDLTPPHVHNYVVWYTDIINV